MTTYDLVLRSSGGLHQSLRITADDAAQALERGGRDGWQVIACDARRPSSVPDLARRRPSIDAATLAHELASLLAAGLSVPDALKTLSKSASERTLARELTEVTRAVAEGLTLSAALERRGAAFPPLLVATVRASEQTGNLSDALLRFAEHRQQLRALRDKVVGAAIYPMLLLTLGAIVVLFLLGVVVPKFATLIESTRQELPWSSRLLMGWGQLVAGHPVATAAVAAGAALVLAVALRQVVAGGGRARWVESLPVVGRLLREFRHAQLYRTTGMLVQGGIPLPKALLLGIDLLGDADRLRLQATVARLQEGRSLSDALQETGLADPLTVGMVTVAERTGALAPLLERIALFKESRVQRSVDWVSRLIEPALMIAIGLVIGAIVVLMYLPIFDLASSLQ